MKLNFTKLTMNLGIALFTLCLNAQVFTSTNGTSNVNANTVGEPNQSNGQVRVKDAPATNGNINNVKNDLQGAGVNSGIINNARVLGNGEFAKQIANMAGAKNTASALNARPATAPTSGAIIIDSGTLLQNNRNILKDNSTRTFVFRGNISVGFPILVGSNKTIWVDGVLNYNGVQVPPEGGADFTPRPLYNDGVFSIRQEATFRRTYKPSNQADRDFNRDLRNNVVKPNRKANTTIRGTKRGKIVVQLGNVTDDKQTLPLANGIVALSTDNIVIDGVNIEGAMNAIYISGSFNPKVINCFTDKTVYRAIHLHGTQTNSANGSGIIKHNLLAFSKFDGIDVDSYSAGFLVEENFVIGARDRFLIWTEIDANGNTINNNVGVVLDDASGGARTNQSGAYQENGTERQRDPNCTCYNGQAGFNGTRNNTWTNNHSFYAERPFDSFVMRKERYVVHNTITFTNNYVWTLETNLEKHNPRTNTLNDVYYMEGTAGTGSGGGGAPIDQIISLRKTGGDLKYVTGENDGSELIARSNVVNAWEKFRIEAHPQGGILLKALSNNQYVQVPNLDTNLPVRNNTNNKSTWERFEWQSMGSGKVAIKSVHSGKWLQAAHNENNGIIRAKGNAAGAWETFTWKLESASKSSNGKNKDAIETAADQEELVASVAVYPNPVSRTGVLNINLSSTDNSSIKLLDISGRLIYISSNKKKYSINLNEINSLSSGIYLLNITSANENKVKKIFIK